MNRQGPTLPPPEALLVACFEQSHDLLLLTDAAGHWRWANPAFCKAVGVHGELCGHLSMLCSTESSVDEVLQQALRQGHLADTEIELRTLGDSPLWVRARANAVGDHRVWVFQPITEQRALAARAEHLTELLEIAQELGQVGIWERDIPSGSGRWSRHVLKLWGLDADEATPDLATTSQLIHEEDRASLHSVFVASTTKAGRYGYRFRIGRPDGHTRWIHAQWEVKNSPQGKPDRVLGVTMDSTEFHDLTRSLGDASAQLTLAVDLADISIWRHDLQTDRMHFNDRGFAVLGLPMRPEGMSVAEVRQLIHPDDMDEVIDSARRALRADRPTHMRARYRRSDGQWRHMLMRRVVQRGADGHALAFVGVALDVTEQVEREHQNLALTQRLELTAVAAGIGIWTLDLDTGVGTWNDQMYHLTGRPRHLPAPSRAEWIETIVYADDREMIERTRGPLVSGQTDRLELEYRIVRPDGALRWLVHRSRREVVNGRVMHVGVSLDITDHRRAELALRAADERAALAARSAGIGTWEVQLEDGLERWDTQMFLLRGLEPRPHPPLRQERIALLHPDDRGISLDAHDGAVGSPRPWRYEFRVVLPDGSIRWLASRSIAIQNEHGKVIRRIGVNWDITDVKEAESARQQIEVAERASQAKSQFLSRMSHELRTPLNAVLGFTQLLLMEEDAATESGRVVKLRHILSAGEHLLTLIDGVLDLSSIEAGRMSLQLQPVDLAGVIEQALPLVTPLARKYGITLRQGALHGTVQADRTRLLQIVVNLLSNAIKYNRPDGLVQIEAGRDGDTTRLWVNDTGRGMTPDQLAHLFEPFNRLGIEREGIDGTGIGMTIVKSLVQAMGGTITVQSQPGRGTQIEIGLVSAAAGPAAAAIAAPSARERERQLEQKPEPTPDIAAQRGGRLLYIEDNFINVTLVEELVQSVPGLQIVSELTGTLGVARAGSMQPDLVMVDMQLPDFDGFEVLRRLRAQPETAGLPCVALSANAMPEDIEQALRAGFVEYWTKPIDLRQFLAAMDRWFPPS